MKLTWHGCTVSEHPDGSATAHIRTLQGLLTVHMKPHVWSDLAFEVARTKAGQAEHLKVREKMRWSKAQRRLA